ncbi:MAG: SAM-dependent methyltransferase [Opitutus sp.]
MNPPSVPDQHTGASPEFLALFRDHAGDDGTMTFARFMELALYDPLLGYYQRARRRIGYEPDTDFFTASTSGAVFGELVAAACVALLGDEDPREHCFVEIGTEPPVPETPVGNSSSSSLPGDPHAGSNNPTPKPSPSPQGILSGVRHPFGTARTIGLGGPIRLKGKCVVFSNELFDAQPFHRFVFRRGAWRELGVQLRGKTLCGVELSAATPAALPEVGVEGYVIDAPLASRALAERVAGEPWTGLFVAIDYGKTWRELIEETPSGTARAYFRHTQSNDLIAQPGEQDLTCHICWDWLSTALLQHRFEQPQVESQEAFFIRHSGGVIASTSANEAARFSRKKLSLLQLLHPSHLGQKFQVLHALRRSTPPPAVP